MRVHSEDIFENGESDNGWSMDEVLIPALGARFFGGFLVDKEWLDANGNLSNIYSKALEPIIAMEAATLKCKMEVSSSKLKQPPRLRALLNKFFDQPSAWVYREKKEALKQGGFLICQNEAKATKRSKDVEEQGVEAIALLTWLELITFYI